MLLLRQILLCVIFALTTSQALAASVRICCPDQHCPVSQCEEMGCISPLGAVAVAPEVSLPFLPAARAFADSSVLSLPKPEKEIWTPPD